MRKNWLTLILLAAAARAPAQTDSHWITTWGTSPSPLLPTAAEMETAGLRLDGPATLRETIHASAGGSMVRVRLSNAFASQAIEIRAVHLAISGEPGTIQPGTDRALTFQGSAGVTLPPNAILLSDPVPMNVSPGADLDITLELPPAAAAGGIHYSSEENSYLAPGYQASAPALTGRVREIQSWIFLAGVDVLAPMPSCTVAAFGDSITEGAHSTVGGNSRWPDFLAHRLRAAGLPEFGILNAGIGGNRLLYDAPVRTPFGVSGLSRFDRDVLAQPGVRYVVFLEGINDLEHPGRYAPLSETITAGQVVAGLRQLAAQAEERGMKAFAGTITPFYGINLPGYSTPQKEEIRQEMNRAIRTGAGFDGVIDLDRAVRDPANPKRLLPLYDSGDHLHPNDRGYEAMANAIDLALLTPPYPDRRPQARMRMEASDQGVVLAHGDGPNGCDRLGARDAVAFEDHGTIYLHYDGSGPDGWVTCLATSRDLVHWQKHGRVFQLGPPGSPDSAGAISPWLIREGPWWHMFYLGTPHATPAPDLIPGFPYLTLKARSRSPAGPWEKEYQIRLFAPQPGTYYSATASPGQVVRAHGRYLMFFSGSIADDGIERTLGIACAKHLDGPWIVSPEPIVPPREQVENSSLYFEPTIRTWFLFTNHIGINERRKEFTDAVWVYWSRNLDRWNPADKATVLDGRNCRWSHACIGMPSVVKIGRRLAVFYDGPGGDSLSHMNRDIGLAWLELPLTIPR